MSHAEKILKRFHQYLRNETALSSGSVVDYVKAAHRILVEDADPKDVPNSGPTMDHLKLMVEKNA